ncbi:MAG: CvpA family protein [Burkholderiales bacterium]|nr:CvpA family protein [Burkholderiales bacterium]
MTWFDYGVLIVVGLSIVLGAWRGLMREALSLAGWVLAAVLAMWFAHDLARVLPASLASIQVRMILAAAVIFVVVLLAAGFGGIMLAKLFRAAGLGVTDRALGGVFGFARGALITLAVVLIAGFTTLPKAPFWRQAVLTGPLETAVVAMKPYLPRRWADRVKYER